MRPRNLPLLRYTIALQFNLDLLTPNMDKVCFLSIVLFKLILLVKGAILPHGPTVEPGFTKLEGKHHARVNLGKHHRVSRKCPHYVSLPMPPLDCMLVNKRWNGSPHGTSTLEPSIGDCQLRCQIDPLCGYWTWTSAE